MGGSDSAVCTRVYCTTQAYIPPTVCTTQAYIPPTVCTTQAYTPPTVCTTQAYIPPVLVMYASSFIKVSELLAVMAGSAYNKGKNACVVAKIRSNSHILSRV